MSIPLAKPPDQRTPFDKGNQWHDWLYKLWTYVQGNALGGTVTGVSSDGSGTSIINPTTSTPTTIHFNSLAAGPDATVTDNGAGTITIDSLPLIIEYVPSATTLTVPLQYQYLLYGNLEVDGTLILDGTLVII